MLFSLLMKQACLHETFYFKLSSGSGWLDAGQQVRSTQPESILPHYPQLYFPEHCINNLGLISQNSGMHSFVAVKKRRPCIYTVQ